MKISTCVLITFVLISIPFQSLAHVTTSKIPHVHYSQGDIDENNVPFYKKFVIIGSCVLPGGAAHAVKLDIKGKKQTYTNSWINPKGEESTEFWIKVEPLTEFREKYEFTLTYYKKPGINDATVNELVNKIYTTLKSELKITLQLSKVKKKIKSVLTQQSKKTANYYHVATDKDKTTLKQGFPTFDDVSIETAKFYFDALHLDSSVSIKKKDLIQKVKVFRTKIQQWNAQIRALNDELKKKKEVKALVILTDIIADPRTVSQSDIDYFTDLKSWSGGIDTKFNALLSNFVFAWKVVLNAQQDVALEKEEFEKSTGKNWSDNIKKRLTEELKSSIRDFFIEQTSVTFFTSAFNTPEPDNNRLNYSTVYGVAYTRLFGNSDNAEDTNKSDAFSYIALKFYLGPVDKSIPKPYIKWSSRFAVLFGAVVKDKITYKGQEMEDAFAGLKPMIGLSYDLFEAIAINGGVLLFRQPNINPLASNEKSSLKVAGYIGLTFDVDIFNVVKGLVDKTKTNQ